jgi:hypothetical protein
VRDEFERWWEKIVAYGVTRIAVECGVTESAVRYWKKNRRVPERHILQCETLAGAKREWARPEMFKQKGKR